MRRRWCRRLAQSSDEGSVLIFALALLAFFGLVAGTLLGLAQTSVRVTGVDRDEAAHTYATDGAMDGAVNNLSNGTTLGAAGVDNTSCFSLPASSVAGSSTAFSSNVAVRCLGRDGSAATTSAVGGPQPAQAVIAGGTSSAEGVNLSGASVAVQGGVQAKSRISVPAGSTLGVSGTAAATTCSVGGTLTANTSSCNAATAATDPGASDLSWAQPGFGTAAKPTSQLPDPVDDLPACASTVTLSPASYYSAGALNSLYSSCPGATFHFLPGVYLFDFQDTGASSSRVWKINDASTTTIGGVANATPTGNLALGKSTTASSLEDGRWVASNATDGDPTTRWSSAFSDPQSIQVDLGSQRSISQVQLTWEAAYGKAYQIQTSTDGNFWTTAYSTTTGAGGTETIPVSATGRYVRMYGTVRGTGYGYSLYEMSVTGSNTPTTCDPAQSGVEFVFAGESQLNVSAGNVDLCGAWTDTTPYDATTAPAAPATAGQHMAVYGLKTSGTVYDTDARSPKSATLSGWTLPSGKTAAQTFASADGVKATATLTSNGSTSTITGPIGTVVPPDATITDASLSVNYTEHGNGSLGFNALFFNGSYYFPIGTIPCNGTCNGPTYTWSCGTAAGNSGSCSSYGISAAALNPVTIQATATDNANASFTATVDSIVVAFTWTEPVSASSGCLLTTAYPSSGCALLKATGAAPSTQVNVHGTVYSWLAPVDLSTTLQPATVVDRGVVARDVQLGLTPAAPCQGPLLSLSTASTLPRRDMVEASIGGTVSGRAEVCWSDVGGALNGPVPDVLSWTHLG